MIRVLLFWLITLGILVGAVSCNPHGSSVYYGPIRVSQDFTLPNSTTTIQSEFMSSHNCVITGRTLTFTLALTNAMDYPIELLNIDMRLEGAKTILWSQTRPTTPSLTLAPHTPTTMQWVWKSDPAILVPKGAFRISPLIQYPDSGILGEQEGSSLSLPIDQNDVGGSCFMP